MVSRLTDKAKTLQHLYERALQGLGNDVAEPEGPFCNQEEQRWYDLLVNTRNNVRPATEAKLYSGPGAATDGAMTQAASTALVANVGTRYADIVKADRTRMYYQNVTALFIAAVSGDVLNLYMPITTSPIQNAEAFLYMKDGLTLNVYGVLLRSNSGAQDVITLVGKNIINAYNSTVTQPANGASGGWLLGAYGNVIVDADINDLNMLVNTNSVAMAISASGSIRYRGNIICNGRYTLRINGALNFSGKGTINQTGLGQIFWTQNSLTHIIWEGNLFAKNSTNIFMQLGKITLRNGILYANERDAGGEQVIIQYNNGDTTVILENYSVLGTPGKPIIQAANVILRGNTVVIGEIICPNISDERPGK